MSLLQLLRIAGGIEDESYIKSIYLDRAEIIRKDENSRYEKIIEIDLNKILENENNDIELKNMDKVIIHANLNYFENDNIQILGEVNIPGSYPLMEDNETLNSVINRSGGLQQKPISLV